MEITQRIVEERKAHGLSQQDIAEYLNTTQQQINKYEHGKQEIPVRRLIELADLYHVSLDYLAGRTNNPKNPNLDT